MKNMISKIIYSRGIKIVTIIVVILYMTGCGKSYVASEALEVLKNDFSSLDKRQVSLENRDYVINLEIDEIGNTEDLNSDDDVAGMQKKYKITFSVADLTEYSGDMGKLQKTAEYSFYSDNMDEALNLYYEENERQLDMGHMSNIYINDSCDEIQSNELVYEMSQLPSVAKSVPITITSGEDTKELILRELIKNVYAGEDF